MAVKVFLEEAPADAVFYVWREGIELGVRPVPESVRDRLSRGYTAGLKASQVQDQPATRAVERVQDIAKKLAAYALVDSKGFELEVPAAPKFVAALAEALGDVGVKVEAGATVLLDHHWSDAVKALVFDAIPLARWVNEKADKLAGADAEAEAAAGKT